MPYSNPSAIRHAVFRSRVYRYAARPACNTHARTHTKEKKVSNAQKSQHEAFLRPRELVATGT
eukprot:1106103-Rhodomonas_salina.1